ncbi:MAG: arginine repressor [Actinomycetota bacterium]|nr:arginine repressor [Actinomycetota bacterium]
MNAAPSGTPRTMTARRSRVAAIIATTAVGSQEELGHALAAEGISVTQATLSRDLDAIGAAKVVEADGSARYVLDAWTSSDTSIPANGTDATVARLTSELLVRAEAAGNIAVLHTPPGAAQFFAGHIDRSTSFDAVGSVAGDDTILLVMRTPDEAAGLCSALLKMAEQRRAQ